MTAPTTTVEAQGYLGDVESELADLPADERSELLEDLALHLAALAEDGDDRTLGARLGSPADYAAELRLAAGLPPRSADGAAHGRLAAATRALRSKGTAVAGSRGVREIRSFLPQLRPAWWVLRGYLVVAVPRLRHVDGYDDFPVPALLGSHLVGGAAVVLAVVVSVMLGRRRLPRFGIAAVLVLDLLVLGAALDLVRSQPARLRSHTVYVTANPGDPFVDSPLITEAHGAVTNILAFTADGKALQDVLLFDQDGRPLATGQQHWFADHCRRVLSPPRAADGTPVPFSYPKQYVLDPEGKTLSGSPVTPGQCLPLPLPKVALPVFPKPAAQTAAKPAAHR
ncbi:MAG: hypothetical protein JWP11_1961 [Frankiales bacterium]|nr:hypothetical protein [Frankiales bacterium]